MSANNKNGAAATAPVKSTVIRAVLDVRDIPIEYYGLPLKSAQLRKFVHIIIATYSDPDGSNAAAGQRRYATALGLTVRGFRNIRDWLLEHYLLSKKDRVGIVTRDGREIKGTDNYTVLVTEEALAKCRAKLNQDEEDKHQSGRAAKTKAARSAAAKMLWAEKKGNTSVPQERGEQMYSHTSPEEGERKRSRKNGNSLHDDGNGLHENGNGLHEEGEHKRSDNRPSCPSSLSRHTQTAIQPPTDGWLVGRLAALWKESTGSTLEIKPDTAREIKTMAHIHGDLTVLLAWYGFLGRPQGVKGLVYPLEKFFLPNVQSYLTDVKADINPKCQELREYAPAAAEEVYRLVKQSIPEAGGNEIAPLMALVQVDGEFSDSTEWRVGLVQDYLENHCSKAASAT